MINRSAFSQAFKYFSKKSSTFALTKSIFLILFFLEFSSQSFEASDTSSTEITFLQ
jgi:hypothetical protein